MKGCHQKLADIKSARDRWISQREAAPNGPPTSQKQKAREEITEVIHRVRAAETFTGEVEPPGDKSISHRAIILNSVANGTSGHI